MTKRRRYNKARGLLTALLNLSSPLDLSGLRIAENVFIAEKMADENNGNFNTTRPNNVFSDLDQPDNHRKKREERN